MLPPENVQPSRTIFLLRDNKLSLQAAVKCLVASRSQLFSPSLLTASWVTSATLLPPPPVRVLLAIVPALPAVEPALLAVSLVFFWICASVAPIEAACELTLPIDDLKVSVIRFPFALILFAIPSIVVVKLPVIFPLNWENCCQKVLSPVWIWPKLLEKPLLIIWLMKE